MSSLTETISIPTGQRAIDGLATDKIRLVTIGASTGSPNLLRNILSNLPADLRVPILVAQHMPPRFTESLARSIARDAALTVHHAEEGMPVLPGVVYIARGHQHMSVWRGDGTRPKLHLSPEPVEKIYRPSADVLFDSADEVYPGRVLSVVMSGIGTDGVEGATRVRRSGGVVIAQHPDSCVIYGMPRACDRAGVSNASLTPEEIRLALLRFASPA
ncbi:CheB methylesterase domain-containing protein [Mucisphaera calidilacus]|uniref:protein-glutamate methylesterase n=1 Tax=Mucisphaera calidilacus TaxID=2527982 RepID=A0A518BY92_9BACT|nr:CheB methylesterase domain-containing protein [Mucisphaera calidilacus]QDU71926.1 Chemotaxis response regulator protein-glutamate methylesterase [Mucisphaera calidilacus]